MELYGKSFCLIVWRRVSDTPFRCGLSESFKLIVVNWVPGWRGRKQMTRRRPFGRRLVDRCLH